MSDSLERRRCHRYSISLDVHFTIRKRGELAATGEGKIQDISRGGIFFESASVIPPGTVLRLVVDWPVRFQGKTRVEWIVDGVVLRSTPAGTAVNIMRQRLERRSTKQKKMAG